MAASGRIKGITIELNGDSTNLVKALSSVDNSIRNTQNNLRDLDRALKLDPGNTELLKDRQQELAIQIDATKQKIETEKQALDQLRNSDGFDENSRQAQNLKTQIDLDTAALKDLESQAKQSAYVLGTQMQVAGEKITAVGDKVKNVGASMSALGQTLTTKVTMPIVGAFAASAKEAIDWETAFTGVMKTVDASEEEYNQLADAIKQMATETASSKEDIAGVMEAAGQLGVTGVDNLIAFTRTMVELGDTTNLSADEAATSLARFMNITGESYTDSDKLGSAIVDLGNNFATTESEIVEMATRLASAGKIAGLSSTDILGLAASMSSVGINAEAGGTAMTQTLTAIDKAVNGLDNGIEDIQKAEKKVAKASRSLESAQDNLKKKQIAYNEAVRKYGEKDAQAQEKATKKVESAMSQLATAQANAEKKQIDYNNAVQKYGEDSTQAQKALINLNAAEDKVEEKTNALAAAQDNLNDAMAGGGTSNAAVEKAMIDLEAAERKVQDATDDLTAEQQNLADMTDGTSDKLELMAQVAGMSADEFSETWSTSPIEAIQAFITGLSSMDEESESTIKILDDLEMSGVRQSNMLKSLSLAADQLGGAISTSGQAYENNAALEEEATKRYETMAAKISQLKERFTNVAVEIGEMLMPTLEKLTGFIEELIDKWNALDESEKENILKTAEMIAVIGPVILIIGKVIVAVGSLVSAIGGIVSAAPAIGTALAAIGAALTGPIGIIIAIVAAVAALAAAIYLNWDKIKEWTAELGRKIQAFGEAVKQGWEHLKADTAEKWNDIKTSVSNKVSETANTVKEKWNNVKDVTAKVWGAVKDKVNENGGGIKGVLKTYAEGWKNIIQFAWNAADKATGGALSNMYDSALQKTAGIRDTIKEKIGDAVDFIKELPGKALQWGKDLIGNFVDGIWATIGSVGEAIGAVANKIASFIHFSLPEDGPLAKANTYMPDMIKLLARGITQSLPILDRAAEQMAGVIANDATPTIQNGEQAASKTVNAPISITVNGAPGQDVNQLADIIQERMNRAVINQRAVFA